LFLQVLALAKDPRRRFTFADTAFLVRGLSLVQELGGVNHCSLHCCLARFRGLMTRGKYGAVIGPKTRLCVSAHKNIQDIGSYKPITAPCFPLIIKPRNLAKLQCKLQRLIPPK